MDDPLDNDLRKRIREVFENFEDASADEGWLLLREKFPEKKKSRRIIWLWLPAAAALLLLFISILWFRPAGPNNQQATISQKEAAKITGVNAQGTKNHGDTTRLVNPSNMAITSTSVSRTAKKPASIQSGIVSALITRTRNKISQEQKEPGQPPAQRGNIAQQPDIANISPPGKQDQYAITNRPKKAISKDTFLDVKPNTAIATTEKPKLAVENPEQKANQKPFENIYADNTKPVQKDQNIGKRVRFSMYATTFFNYAHGSSNQFNAGGGFTSDIRLSKRFSISTGVAIAQNTLSYNIEPPPSTASQTNQIATASVTFAASNTFHIAAPTFRNYNADLIGLDVPLNLKYTFNPEKGGTYIMAGLSSGTFINETYTYSYNDPAPFSANVSQVQDQTTHNSFNSFYFARTLNLSFGTGYSLGKNRLIIEPFLKYPLDGLGTQQIRFGAGGINLKFSFSGK
ncbi:MAG TPA: hypothetical protein VHC47_02655 [Mucilaginibacter sp.]|nr:hypothetical protein [Mucilaginibacter sp.]